MPIKISPVIPAQAHTGAPGHYFRALQLAGMANLVSPITVVFDSRAVGRPITPHPHAGLTTITYIFEDSHGGLRSRDTLGNDVTVGPGGVVWTESCRGIVHEELPSVPSVEVHGLVAFVNLTSANKLEPARVNWLQADEIPIWQDKGGNQVRVVAGTYGNLSSPLQPMEPFTLLDVSLRQEISFHLPAGHNALVYVSAGTVTVRGGHQIEKVTAGNAVALQRGGDAVLEAADPSQLIILSAPAIDEPVVYEWPFIMNSQAEVQAAHERYRNGGMGRLAPT
ncbi:pirin family protein [Mesorhizobium sp. B2-1-8]|uniref:pirin family protein n=1 Tax=Mesorhizobium sp. B2-1-8 TaxID=2589967 RepID=UPI001128FA8C|nr:pirin-like C-terminal cupin domain-containing protein [Mesorhizobium sp. B2-1-8]UCI19934.1 pirin family protein [Mesorhizobium sp. B2-1-8]